MEDHLSYIDDDGNYVHTSQYLKNRKTCCKSGCRHCPYGYTVKKFGLQFQDVTEKDLPTAQNIANDFDLTENFELENIKYVLLKGTIAGVITKDKLFVKNLFLKKHFQDQDISKELVESYYFY